MHSETSTHEVPNERIAEGPLDSTDLAGLDVPSTSESGPVPFSTSKALFLSSGYISNERKNCPPLGQFSYQSEAGIAVE